MGTIKEIAKQTQMIINKGSGQLLTIKGNNKTDASTYYLDGHVVKQRQNASILLLRTMYIVLITG